MDRDEARGGQVEVPDAEAKLGRELGEEVLGVLVCVCVCCTRYKGSRRMTYKRIGSVGGRGHCEGGHDNAGSRVGNTRKAHT